jgi:serine/threonine protein kinase
MLPPKMPDLPVLLGERQVIDRRSFLLTPPTFTNKVDIWSLGCILFELVTFTNAFAGDWGVLTFFHSSEPSPQIQTDTTSAFLKHHVLNCLCHLLQKPAQMRPGATILCRLFSIYEDILIRPSEEQVEIDNYPQYAYLQQLAAKPPTDPEPWFRLTDFVVKAGNAKAASECLAKRFPLLDVGWRCALYTSFLEATTDIGMPSFVDDPAPGTSDVCTYLILIKGFQPKKCSMDNLVGGHPPFLARSSAELSSMV